jgi:hypothetical protein
MQRRWLAVVFAWAILAIPGAANALQTTWEFKGHLTSLDPGSSFPPDFTVDAPFRILVSFDTTGESNYFTKVDSGGGAKYFYTGNTLAYQVFIGTNCAPCEPDNDPTQSGIIVRDSFSDLVGVPPGSLPPVDGYSFSLYNTDGVAFSLIMRGPAPDIVTGPGLAAVPDPQLAGLDTHVMQICMPDGHCVNGAIESVESPSVGTTYFLSARDCQFIDTTTTIGLDAAPRDCVYVNSNGLRRLGYGRYMDAGGGLGTGDFSRAITFDSLYDGSITSSLGSVFGAVAFNGPAGLPVLKASSTPRDIARNNSNLLAFQRYTYTGAATSLPLVVDLTYGIADYSSDTAASDEIGLRPGGAQIAATIAIVDGSIPMPSVSGNINSLTCGAESTTDPQTGAYILTLPDGVSPWPAGSILGSASFDSTVGQIDPAASATLDVRSCADPSKAVQLAASQSFIVATSIQTPSRGKWSTGAPAAANGDVDASHTMRVTFDPNAAPALVQQLTQSIAPGSVTKITVDVQPGSTGCLNPTSNGVIPVAILGSASFQVKDVRLDETLQLGSLALRVRGGKPLCSVTQVNADGYDDLMCHFDNVSTNWTSGQTTATVSGKLYDGVPVQGSDAICVK